MLQAIRSQATSFVVKILFGALIVSFAIWGIGDIFRDNGSADTTVATVGGQDISVQQVSQQVQTQLNRLRQVFGNDIDTDQAKKLGIVDQALDGIVANTLVDLEVNRLGLSIGDQAVRDAIFANPAFHNQQGQFDRNIYEQVLAQNNLTDPQFEAMQRTDLLKAQLTSAVGSGITPPKELVDTLYRSRAERRVATLATVPASAAADPGQPSAQQLETFYKAHPDLFQAPERRSFTVAELTPAAMAKEVKVTDEQLKQHYEQYPDEFRTPEQRQVQQMLLPDEATAKAAEDALRQGKNFATVAKQVAKMNDPASLDLGLVKREDLPPELASAAFSLKEGEVSQPIKSAFGWHILRVTKIDPASGQTFDQVKDKLRQQLAKDQAANKVADLANNIDDAVAGGANFDEVVKKFGLKTVTATQVGSDGKDAKGAAPDLGDDHDAILKTAFATQAGQMSQLQDDGHNGYYIVKVDKVTPAQTRPLADVHDLAVGDWQAAERKQELQKIAQGMVQQVNAGHSLKDVAAAQKLTVTTSPALQRTSGDASVPPSLVAQIFSAKKGNAVSEAVPDGIIVAQVQSVEPADPKADPGAVKQLSDELAQAMQGDLLTEYDHSLRSTFPVTKDQAKLDQVL